MACKRVCRYREFALQLEMILDKHSVEEDGNVSGRFHRAICIVNFGAVQATS